MLELSQKPDLGHKQELAAKTILIVDDEAVIRDLCKRALKGYNVIEAGGGEAALTAFEKGGIDVVLTDVMMPCMDGIELLKRIKEQEPTIVVIVMTGFAEKDVILNALKADADDFIAKPLNLLQLKTAVDKALQKKSLKEEIAALKSLDVLKSNFLSTISHKFRTPITSISLFLQNVAAGVFSADDPEFRSHVKLISEESAYLERLVADLLVFSRVMDTGFALKKEPVLVSKVISGIFMESREIALKPGITTHLDIDEAVTLLADREKIIFALRQIIENAFKFTGRDGEVSITLVKESGGIIIQITDSGIGIAAEDIPKIFEKFYQVDPYNTGQVRGFGLGLFYAREFIRAHGGSITIQSSPGKGTQVTVALPYESD